MSIEEQINNLSKCTEEFAGCINSLPEGLFLEKLDEWVKVSKRGKVHTYTVAYIDTDGSKLKKPIIWAMIKIDNVHGGFVHKLGGVNLEDVKIGLQVEAVFKNKREREGSMLDIKYFKPAK